MIELKNVSKTYKSRKGQEVHALKNVSLKFDNNGMTFILGKSGSGKSTLLNILGGLDQYDSGDMIILGKSSKNFSNSDFDFYRNTYVGFVFQEFNLLSDYNVCDNIKLTLQLGQKEINDNKINQLLEKLEILELKNREISELSGGQKQRISTARALIKNPRIILADEPTGNLDSKTSKQVLNLLKEISKEKLVIVVSHDRESAQNYADRIIEFKDGEVISDTKEGKIEQKNDLKYKSEKSKLHIRDSLKLGFNSLKHKKIKLFFTVLLTSFALLFLSLTDSLYSYKLEKGLAGLLVDEKIDYVQIGKYRIENNDYTRKEELTLQDDDIDFINRETKKIGVPVYKLNLQNYGTVSDVLHINNSDEDSQYYRPLGELEIVEANSKDEVVKEEIIGKFSEKSDEIVISNYLADIIINNGISEFTEKNNSLNPPKIFYPKNYEELISSKKLFYLDNLKSIKIVGIVKYDLTKYQELKENSDQINQTFISLNIKAQNFYNKIFVKKGFVDSLKLNKSDNLTSNNYYNLIINGKSMNKIGFALNYAYLDHEIEYFDGSTWKKTNKLDKKEMLLNISQIDGFDYNNYVKQLNKNLKEIPNEDKFEYEKQFLVSYISKFDIIGKPAQFNVYEGIPQNSSNIDGSPTETYKDITITGIIGLYNEDSVQTILSKDLVGKYQESPTRLSNLMIKEEAQKGLETLLEKFPYDETFSATTPFSLDILSYISTINLNRKIALNVGLIFLAFTIILISNFIFTSISYRKKEIGILRSLGTTNKDIVKVFLWESLMVAIISGIIGSVFSIVVSQFLNSTIMSNSLSTKLVPFIIEIRQFSVIFIISLGITFISTLIPLRKISKMKPIDAILNK